MGTMFSCSIAGLRSWPIKGFEATRIYYIEADGVLLVLRILHGKRNVRRVLREGKKASSKTEV
jgi:toxin ParE1/3/4